MLQKTKALVMRSVRYGETSLVVTAFTEVYGLQSYMVSGVRKESARTSMKASHFQPAVILELVAYHREGHGLQRIKESQRAVIYRNIDSDIRKHSVVFFMMELLQKCLRQPEAHPELFHFMEDALLALDDASPRVSANFPVFFVLHLSHFFGFRISDTSDGFNGLLDLQEGLFVQDVPSHPHWTGRETSLVISQFLKAQHPTDLEEILLNREGRRQVLASCLLYYNLHLPDFGTMRSLPVLQELMD